MGADGHWGQSGTMNVECNGILGKISLYRAETSGLHRGQRPEWISWCQERDTPKL
jgi:hypothetical protein